MKCIMVWIGVVLMVMEISLAFTTVPLMAAPHQSSVVLTAKKRRRRKDKTSTTTDRAPTTGSDDLPDFDIADEDETTAAAATVPRKTTAANRVIATTETGEKITANMMGSAGAPTKSVRDLINDRSLEQKLEFDDDDAAASGQDLPDLIQMARERRGEGSGGTMDGAPVSKKKARQAARQAAAAAREQEEESSLQGLLQKIPFLLDEKNGKVSGFKILEAGTWAGIGLLVAWEIYINSPFFERAAPVIPVVY